jgi:hypothetical protein
MTRRHLTWLLTMAALAVLVTVSAPAFPREEPPPAGSLATPAAADKKGEETVETILRQQEQLRRGQRFSYSPDGRRDPFRSLYESVPGPKGPRPVGVAGMLVTELDLTGIVKDANGGDVALVIGSDNKGYFLRVGDLVYDGTVIAVDPRQGEITFRQQVDDPRLIKPYRDVVKKLVPVNEESGDE